MPQNLYPTARTACPSLCLHTRSPQKVLDVTPESESRTSLPSLFKIRNGLQSLRPGFSEEHFSWEQQQQEEQRRPRLLQR